MNSATNIKSPFEVYEASNVNLSGFLEGASFKLHQFKIKVELQDYLINSIQKEEPFQVRVQNPCGDPAQSFIDKVKDEGDYTY